MMISLLTFKLMMHICRYLVIYIHEENNNHKGLTCWEDSPVSLWCEEEILHGLVWDVHCSLLHWSVAPHWRHNHQEAVRETQVRFSCCTRWYSCFAHQRTLSHVCVAPKGDPATIGTWIEPGFFPITVSNFSSKARHVVSSTCSFASMLSNLWQMAWLMDISIAWKEPDRWPTWGNNQTS